MGHFTKPLFNTYKNFLQEMFLDILAKSNSAGYYTIPGHFSGPHLGADQLDGCVVLCVQQARQQPPVWIEADGDTTAPPAEYLVNSCAESRALPQQYYENKTGQVCKMISNCGTKFSGELAITQHDRLLQKGHDHHDQHLQQGHECVPPGHGLPDHLGPKSAHHLLLACSFKIQAARYSRHCSSTAWPQWSGQA